MMNMNIEEEFHGSGRSRGRRSYREYEDISDYPHIDMEHHYNRGFEHGIRHVIDRMEGRGYDGMEHRRGVPGTGRRR